MFTKHILWFGGMVLFMTSLNTSSAIWAKALIAGCMVMEIRKYMLELKSAGK